MTTPALTASRKITSRLSLAIGGLAGILATLAPSFTENAIANGDTRTIYLHHAHTGEDIAATYLVNGQYDSRVLQQLNWFLRDWRRDEPTNMDPRLFDVVWETYRSAGAGNQVINVVSAYRSPETNAMLRARSRAVAKYSQHMLGKAMDTTMPGMPMSTIREIGMRMQRGGVGYYPTAGTPFVHLDVGNVRSWPRMTYDQLMRLFPDGKTVHLPTNGQPLARYEEARAEIEARNNGAYVTAPRRSFGGFLASLFGGGGGGGEDDDSEYAAPAPSTRKQWRELAPRQGRAVVTAATESDEEGAAAPNGRRGRSQLARAEENLPRGETAMSAPGAEVAATPQEPQKAARYVNAPLPPPGRPASIDKPTPLDTPAPERSASVAALEGAAAGELRSSVDGQDGQTEQAPEAVSSPARRYVNAPLPPHRPASLVPSTSVAATRPERPAAQADGAAAHAIANLVDPADGEAGRAAGPQDDAALAYTAQPPETAQSPDNEPEVRGEIRPARRGGESLSARSVMGSTITGVRSAARATGANAVAPPRRPQFADVAKPDAASSAKPSPASERGR